MIYILEFVFTDDTKYELAYTKDKEILNNVINKKLNCEFINSIIECEPNSMVDDIYFYKNIKIPFSRKEFINYINNDTSINLMDIYEYFSDDTIINESIETVRQSIDINLKISILTKIPHIYDVIAKDAFLDNIAKHNDEFHEVREDASEITIGKNTFYPKCFYAAIAMKKLSENIANHTQYILDVHDAIISFKLRKDQNEHAIRILKVSNNNISEIHVNNNVLLSNTSEIYNLTDEENNIEINICYSKDVNWSRRGSDGSVARVNFKYHNNTKNIIVGTHIIDYDFEHYVYNYHVSIPEYYRTINFVKELTMTSKCEFIKIVGDSEIYRDTPLDLETLVITCWDK